MDKRAVFVDLFRKANGLIFDFDGLLADSEKHHYLSYKEVFARYGHELDEGEYYKHWTSLGEGSEGEIRRHDLDLDPVKIRREKRPIFSRYCENGSVGLFPEARDMLEMLAGGVKTLAIASGTPTHDIRAVLRNAGIGSLFSVILGSDVVPQLKPAPDIFVRTLRETGLEAHEGLVFEDAEKGISASVTAGIPVVAVRNRETKHFDFSAANLVLESHAELLRLVGHALS